MFSESIFDIAKGTELEPKYKGKISVEPDPFLEYNNIVFGIGMDCKLYIREDNVWRKVQEKENGES
jgi:hypothetical protein